MIQLQVVEYAKSQLKLGVSRQAVKDVLLGAGWAETDVEDSLRNIVAEVITPAQPAGSKPQDKNAIDISSIFGPKPEPKKEVGAGPRVVSDLSIGKNPEEIKPNGREESADKNKKVAPEGKKSAGLEVVFGSPGPKMGKSAGSRKFLITIIALGVVCLGAIAGAVWLYMENSGLRTEVEVLEAAGMGLGVEVSGLNSRITSLESETQFLRREKEALEMEFSILAAPPGAVPVEFSGLRGTLGGGGAKPYSILIRRGAEVLIKNSKEKAAADALKPLIGTETELSGTYIPGSKEVTVSVVNGLPIVSP